MTNNEMKPPADAYFANNVPPQQQNYLEMYGILVVYCTMVYCNICKSAG